MELSDDVVRKMTDALRVVVAGDATEQTRIAATRPGVRIAAAGTVGARMPKTLP